MTCIVAVVEGEPGPGATVLMAADSGSADGWMAMPMETPKLFRNGPALIGCTSSWRFIDLMHHALDVPAVEPTLSSAETYRYMVRDFVPAVRKCLTDAGWSEKKNNRDMSGVALIAVNGCLFWLGEDFSVTMPATRYCAVGSGYLVAIGALAASEDGDVLPQQRLGHVMKIVERHCATVRGPFTVAVLEATGASL